jgi:hypothetical protein
LQLIIIGTYKKYLSDKKEYINKKVRVRVRVMVFNSTFNNISVISWWSELLVEETGENH